MLRCIDPGQDPLTLAEAKAQCRVEHDAEDAFIEDLVRVGRQLAEVHSRRALGIDVVYRLSLDAFPDRITLPKPPLQAVLAVRYVDSLGAWQTLAPAAYQVVDAEPAYIVPAYGTYWPSTRCQPAAVEVEFRAGYAAATDVPATARQAIALLVGHYFANREAVVAGNWGPLPLAVESLLIASEWGCYP